MLPRIIRVRDKALCRITFPVIDACEAIQKNPMIKFSFRSDEADALNVAWCVRSMSVVAVLNSDWT